MNKIQKVLIVEDEAGIRMITHMALSDIGGLETQMANNGQEALNILAKGWKPDLILMDVMMPELNGVETIKKLKASHDYKDIPVIFMTARSMDNSDYQYFELGALDVIIKPFDPMTLLDQISESYKKRNS